MDSDYNLIFFKFPEWFRLFGSFITALIITSLSIPTIVKISKFKKLFDIPNERKPQIYGTPYLGGLAVFAGLTVSSIVFSLSSESNDIKVIIGALIVLFFTGMKDDILIIDPKKKLLGQVFASLIITWVGQIRITTFHNLFGIEGISPFLSIVFTLFVLVVIINGFNLIDGVDGLATGIGLFATIIYGVWFILTDHITYGIIAVAFAGALMAFFSFNVFGKRFKIFLGDTGSLITGLVIAVLTIQFLESEPHVATRYQFNAVLSMAIGILIIPLSDTLRVLFLRLFNGKSPFKADRNHIHHSLLNLGLSHLNVTIILVLINLLFVLIAYLLQNIGDVMLILLMAILATLLSYIPNILLRLRSHSAIIQKGQD